VTGNDLPVLPVLYEDRGHDDTPISGLEAVLKADHRRFVAQRPDRHTLVLDLEAREPGRELLLVNRGDRGTAGG